MKKSMIRFLAVLAIALGATEAFSSTVETIFTLSEDKKTAMKYLSQRIDGIGDLSFSFDPNFNIKNINYARPSNYSWTLSADKKYKRLIFGQTQSYGFLEKIYPAQFYYKREGDKSNQFRIFVYGSQCIGGCILDENIISSVIPSKFKVIDYWGQINDDWLDAKKGSWKVVDNTYTFYSKNVNSAAVEFLVEEAVDANYDAVSNAFINNNNIQIVNDGNKVRVVMPQEGMFASGNAQMQKTGLQWIKQLVGSLADSNYLEIRVEGHTDNIPVSSKQSQFPSNWELSGARASNIVQFLVSAGIPANKLASVGYADSRPVAPNDTDANRAKNRRIEFSIVTSERSVSSQ